MSPGVSRRTPGVRVRPPNDEEVASAQRLLRSRDRDPHCHPRVPGYVDPERDDAAPGRPGARAGRSGAAERPRSRAQQADEDGNGGGQADPFTAVLADQARPDRSWSCTTPPPRTQRRQWSGRDRTGLPPHPASAGPHATTHPGAAAGQPCRRPKHWPRPRNSTNPPRWPAPATIWAKPGHSGAGAAQMNARAGMVSSVKGRSAADARPVIIFAIKIARAGCPFLSRITGAVSGYGSPRLLAYRQEEIRC